MGFRVRKSFNFGAGRVNLSKSGAGWSVGGKGFRFTQKAGGGTRTTAFVPGTGLSYVKDGSAKGGGKSSGTSSPGATGSEIREKIQIKKLKNWQKIIILVLGIISTLLGAIAVGASCGSSGGGCTSFVCGAVLLLIGMYSLNYNRMRAKAVSDGRAEYIDGCDAEPADNRSFFWWLLLGWWWWMVELFVWLLAAPIAVVVEYVRHASAKDNVERFSARDAAQSELRYKLEDFTLYDVPFYRRAWFLGLLGLCVPPLSIAAILAKRRDLPKKTKTILCIILGLWWLLIVMPVSCAANQGSADPSVPGVVSGTDISATDRQMPIAEETAVATETTTTTTTTTATTTTTTTTTIATTTTKYVEMVWICSGGARYHCRSSCSNMDDPWQVSIDEAKARGLTPCGRCY